MAISETLQKYSQEKDIDKKKAMLNDIIAKTETDEMWKGIKQSLGYYKTQIPQAYLAKKDYVNFKKSIEELNILDKAELASLYNNTAWEMQKTSENLVLAEELSRFATTYAKESWQNPDKKPTIIRKSNGRKIIDIHMPCTLTHMEW
jgi:hypothetical protein